MLVVKGAGTCVVLRNCPEVLVAGGRCNCLQLDLSRICFRARLGMGL